MHLNRVVDRDKSTQSGLKRRFRSPFIGCKYLGRTFRSFFWAVVSEEESESLTSRRGVVELVSGKPFRSFCVILILKSLRVCKTN